MNLYVLDASAWIRLYLADGPVPEGLDDAASSVDRGESGFVAPELILVETAHALHRKCRRGVLSHSERDALWQDMRRTRMDLLPAIDHIDRATALAEKYHVTVYDALYLAVAEHVGAPLFTADTALAKAAR